MEMMCLPLSDVQDRFTKSEMFMLYWRSQEQYWRFKRQTEDSERQRQDIREAREYNEEAEPVELEDGAIDVDELYARLDERYAGKPRRKKVAKEPVVKKGKKHRKEYSGQVPSNLPDKFYNEYGEIDLRQVTGAEAMKYFSLLGIKLPIIHRSR